MLWSDYIQVVQAITKKSAEEVDRKGRDFLSRLVPTEEVELALERLGIKKLGPVLNLGDLTVEQIEGLFGWDFLNLISGLCGAVCTMLDATTGFTSWGFSLNPITLDEIELTFLATEGNGAAKGEEFVIYYQTLNKHLLFHPLYPLIHEIAADVAACYLQSRYL
jgi:hypothetical protein